MKEAGQEMDAENDCCPCKFKWSNFHLFQFCLIATNDSIWGIDIFHSIKNKNANKNLTPQRLLVRKGFWQAQEETTFALKNPRIAFCYRVKGLTLCHECNYEHAGPARCKPGSEPHNSLLIKHHSHIPRENKHEWYKNTQRGWLCVVCPRKTNTAWPAGKMADNKTR